MKWSTKRLLVIPHDLRSRSTWTFYLVLLTKGDGFRTSFSMVVLTLFCVSTVWFSTFSICQDISHDRNMNNVVIWRKLRCFWWDIMDVWAKLGFIDGMGRIFISMKSSVSQGKIHIQAIPRKPRGDWNINKLVFQSSKFEIEQISGWRKMDLLVNYGNKRSKPMNFWKSKKYLVDD